MHEPYEDYEDGYDDDDHNNDYPIDPYKWYYKFDIGSDTPLSQWISDMFNEIINPTDESIWDQINKAWGFVNIPGFPSKKFPVSSWNPNTENNKFQYLGSNYHNVPIWKTKYFIIDKINTEYKLHLQNYAKHFVSQPSYYKSMFDILN